MLTVQELRGITPEIHVRKIVARRVVVGGKAESVAVGSGRMDALKASWRARNPERVKEIQAKADAKHYWANVERLRAESRERMAKRYAENKDAILARIRTRYAALPKKKRAAILKQKREHRLKMKAAARYMALLIAFATSFGGST